MPAQSVTFLAAENKKLRMALSRLIPWVGILPDGPSWATTEAKVRNREACAKALSDADECFPENFNATTDFDDSGVVKFN